MRALNTSDVFKAMRIVKALGIKEEFKQMALSIQAAKKIPKAQEVGFDVIITILGNAGNCENEVYDFLSGVLEIDKNDLPTMDFLDLTEQIRAWVEFNDSDRWAAFFDALAAMTK